MEQQETSELVERAGGVVPTVEVEVDGGVVGGENVVPEGAVKEEGRRWYVMRDLTRRNAKRPAWKMLEAEGVDYFTPMVWKVRKVGGRHRRERIPFMQDLVFVHERREVIDPLVKDTKTFQYRYLLHREPMTVRDSDMERFVKAVSLSDAPQYYLPEEVTPEMRYRRIRIIGGPLDGYEGTLVTLRGSKSRRLLVELPTLLVAAVEVEPEYIQLI